MRISQERANAARRKWARWNRLDKSFRMRPKAHGTVAERVQKTENIVEDGGDDDEIRSGRFWTFKGSLEAH